MYTSPYCSIIVSFLLSQNAVCHIILNTCHLATKRRSDLWVSLLPILVWFILYQQYCLQLSLTKNCRIISHISCKEKNVGVDVNVSISLYFYTCLWLYISLYILYSRWWITRLFHKNICLGKKKRRSPGQQYGRTWDYKDGLTVAARVSFIITTSSLAVTRSTTETE